MFPSHTFLLGRICGNLEAVKNTMLSTDWDSYGSSTNQCLQNRTGAKRGQLKLLLLLHQISAGSVAQNARETRLTARAVHSWFDESRESRAFVSIGGNLCAGKKVWNCMFSREKPRMKSHTLRIVTDTCVWTMC